MESKKILSKTDTLNPAAERILGLEAHEMAGRGFAELFILREGFDDFTQLVTDATTGDAGAQRRVVEVRAGRFARRCAAGGGSDAGHEGLRQGSQAACEGAEALKRLREQEDWESIAVMIKARRSFARIRLDMAGHRTAINKSRFLFKEGLIAASEHEDAERQFRGQEREFITAEEELAAVRAQGSGDALKDAHLELKTASAKLRAAEAALAHGELRAPTTGVVLAAAPRGGPGVAVGSAVRAGQELLTIGDFSRMMASVKVDETDVVNLQAGQKVKVTGNAFPDLTLTGGVTHVASQADPQSRGIPKFGAAVTLGPVKPELAGRLKAGMSVQLRIVTYDNPDALSAPLSAVDSRGVVHRLRVVDPDTGAVEEREVEIGWTARDSVEIRAGLKVGETILVPGG